MYTVEQAMEDNGFTRQEVEQGYGVFNQDGILLIQKLDCLEGTELQKFRSDAEAGEQALKDGFKLFTLSHSDYEGYYILDNRTNRRLLKEEGVLK